MSTTTTIRCDEIVGCRLLKFFDGIDMVNFLEAVDNSEQFGSIAKAFDHHFVILIHMFQNHQKILLPKTLWHYYKDICEIDEERLCVVPRRYSFFIQPSERLYIHPCFSREGFSELCEAYKTSLFKCYSRLLPLNSVYYDADFGLLDYEWYSQTVGSKRTLNDHEKSLFKVQKTFPTTESRNEYKNMSFVCTVKEFKTNLAVRFSSVLWLEAIDFSKFIITSGCVLNCLCKLPFSDTKDQDVNLIYYVNNLSDFEISVQHTIDRLKEVVSKSSADTIKIEKVPGSFCYYVFLPCNVRLTFSTRFVKYSKQPISHILHNFDIDISQIAFTGDRIICTFPFLQALATQSFIVYTLYAESPKHLCIRTGKYYNRGFDLLLPSGFDGDLKSMMEQEEIPLYRIEDKKYIDDEGEVYTVTIESYRDFVHNIDTYRLQEKFMSNVCPKLLEYKRINVA